MLSIKPGWYILAASQLTDPREFHSVSLVINGSNSVEIGQRYVYSTIVYDDVGIITIID